MPSVTLSDDQVFNLATQLSPERQAELLRRLITLQWPQWDDLSRFGEDRIRTVAAQRGLDWDAMSDDQRDALVNELVHEDRACGS